MQSEWPTCTASTAAPATTASQEPPSTAPSAPAGPAGRPAPRKGAGVECTPGWHEQSRRTEGTRWSAAQPGEGGLHGKPPVMAAARHPPLPVLSLRARLQRAMDPTTR